VEILCPRLNLGFQPCRQVRYDGIVDLAVERQRVVPAGRAGPAQVLFERFAAEVELPVSRSSPFQGLWRNAVAPLRALAFPLAALCYRLLGKNDKSAAYQKVGRYWRDYICNAPSRRRLYRQRNDEIGRMKFDVRASLVS